MGNFAGEKFVGDSYNEFENAFFVDSSGSVDRFGSSSWFVISIRQTFWEHMLTYESRSFHPRVKVRFQLLDTNIWHLLTFFSDSYRASAFQIVDLARVPKNLAGCSSMSHRVFTWRHIPCSLGAYMCRAREQSGRRKVGRVPMGIAGRYVPR